MKKPHENDICIGPGEWITSVDIDAKQISSAVDIDPLLSSMADFLARLETNCVAECCGIDAFDLWPENIRRAAALSGDRTLHQKLAALKAFIVEREADCFGGIRLNNYFHRNTLLQLVDHIDGHIPA